MSGRERYYLPVPSLQRVGAGDQVNGLLVFYVLQGTISGTGYDQMISSTSK